MIYGLIFLEHPAATSQEQRDAIIKYANKHNFNIDTFISYKKKPNISLFKAGDSAVCYAWNCICKEKTVLNKFILHLLQNNVHMHSATSAYCIDSTKDFQQFVYAFRLFEDIRFNFVSGRSIAAAKTRVANGKAPGRHFGSKNKRHVLDGKEKTIRVMHANGASMYAIAKKLKVSAPTIKRFLAAQKEQTW